MAPGKKGIYWDTCVFISLLDPEPLPDGGGRTKDEIAQLRQLETLLETRSITVFTSSLTRLEVLESASQEREALFSDLLDRVDVVTINSKILDIAREIRSFYRNQNQSALIPMVPDAIHLATAIHYEARSLYTYDGCGKHPKKSDLLQLPRPIIAKYDIDIRKPEVPPEFAPKTPQPEPVQAEKQVGTLFDLIEELKSISDGGEK